VGLVEFMEFYEILDVIFSHFKIKTPDGESGWIYAGRPNDLWIKANIVNAKKKNSSDIESEVKEKFDDGN
jgi:hypothetical protein